MSLEHEEQLSVDQPAEPKHEYEKTLRISYTRDYLLSLSQLDVCKKLPTGFDHSILSEFEDSSYSVLDRQRVSGSLSLQSFRRNEYGSSPPTRGDSSNSSRGIHGRWDSRSSGRSDKDSDSQSDWDSDSGRRFGNQSRRSWQAPEHDGLLGSGSFPRPAGYAAGASAPKVRANDQYQLSRSNEPYHPPRPYKAVPHSRRDTNDLYNDETFGSVECTSQDRAEEERKRRASFELMRKEQQKAFQEKQNLNPDKQKNDSALDVTALLEDRKDEKRLLNKKSEVDESVIAPGSHNDSGKSSLPSQTPASRPLVPPGFTSTILERSFGTKSSIHPHPAEVENPELEYSLSHSQGNSVLNGAEKKSAHQVSQSEQHHQTIQAPFFNKTGSIVSSSDLESSAKTVDLDQSYMTSNVSTMHEVQENGESLILNMKKTGGKNVGEYNQDNSTSILDKLFGSALAVASGGSSSFIEHHDSKADDSWSPGAVQSSKFSHWFLEDESKPANNLSSGRPSDLLSLITGSEKAGSQDLKTSKEVPLDSTSQHAEIANKHTSSNLASATVGISEQLYNGNKPHAVPGVLTCEDLEQSILSEISDSVSTPTVQGWSSSDAKTEQPKTNIDNRASQHLLSLLQRGLDQKDVAPSCSLDMGSSDKLNMFEKESISPVPTNSSAENAEKVKSSGTTLTLETLFGSAFMQELQSVEAPVSVQRGSVGSARINVLEPHGLSVPVMDDGLLPSTVGETKFSRTGPDSNVLASNHRQPAKSDKIGSNWLHFDDPRTDVDSSQLQTEVASKLGGFDGEVDIRLPEEDSLITVSDPMHAQHSKFMHAGNSSRAELLSSNTPIDIAEQLAALNAVLKDERSMGGGPEGPPFLRTHHEVMDHHNLHAQPSSSQLHHPQMNHGRPLFHPLDSHPAQFNSQLKFMAPESIIHHDPPPNHQFPANVFRPPFHHPSTGLTGFDPSTHHPMLQQIHMPGNFPPPHLLRAFPRGAPVPPRPNNQATGFIQEVNPLQGFPFGHRQPNFGSLGMSLPAADVGDGGNHPDAIQRLFEMEMRAKTSKQMHPLAAAGGGSGGGSPAGHSQGMYGQELDTGFRYNR